MRIKCPRCGLVNKSGILECQSCGEDLSGLADRFDGRSRDDELNDSLSLNPKKLRQQRKGKSKPQTEELFKDFGDDVDWRSELNKRVAEIKKEKETSRSGKKAKDEDKKIQSNLIFDDELEDEDELLDEEEIGEEIINDEGYDDEELDTDEEELPEDEFDDARKNAMEIVESLKKKKKKAKPAVYEDDHYEDYDEDKDEDYEEDEFEDDLDEDEEVSEGRERHYDEPIPSDPEEIKKYIARKVAMRKGKLEGKSPSLAEEYGYKRKRKKQSEPEENKYKKINSKKIEPPPLDYDDDLDSIYRPVEGKPKYKAAENILAEETRTLVNFKRLYAAIWDNLLLILMTLVIIKFGSSVLKIGMGELISVSWWRFLIFYIVLAIIYNVYFTTSNGQTIGKMMFHIRMISESGYQVSLGKIIMHCLLTIFSLALATVGYLWFFFDFRGRNLADIVTRTKIQLFQE